jgi:phosphoribosylformylglycinamidine cyclo-ligase
MALRRFVRSRGKEFPMASGEDLYAKSGVDTSGAEKALGSLLRRVRETLVLPGAGAVALGPGFFAAVLDLGNNLGLALSTDNVGTKVLVAQMVGKYDTVGIDCVAINVNDILCVGARPLAIVDYLAVAQAKSDLLDQVGAGFAEGCKQAETALVGGELAQVPDIVVGERPGYAFDLSGSCVGTLDLRRMVTGKECGPGDVIIGIASSGIHCNGLSLARQILFKEQGWKPDRYVPELGRAIGEELLEPTAIYAREVRDLLASGIPVHGLAHISGDGLLNILRLQNKLGYVIEQLPPAPPVFEVIQRLGNVPDEEMFRIFNMGLGFCVIVPAEDSERAISICKSHGRDALPLGRVASEPEGAILIEPHDLRGEGNRFHTAR